MSKRAVEELTAEVAHLRESVALLQTIVKQQQEDIQMLKTHIQRMDQDSAHTAGSSSSGGSGKLASLPRSESAQKLTPGQASSSPKRSSRSISKELLLAEPVIVVDRLDTLTDHEMIQANDEIASPVEFRKMVAAIEEIPPLPFTEQDQRLIGRKVFFDGVRAEVEALKAALLESRESRHVADAVYQQSSGTGSPSNSGTGAAAIGATVGLDRTLSYSGGAIAKVRNSPEPTKPAHPSPSKPHPFNSSNSTPAFTMTGSSAHLAVPGTAGQQGTGTSGGDSKASGPSGGLTRQGTSNSITSSQSTSSGETARSSLTTGSSPLASAGPPSASESRKKRPQSTNIPPSIGSVTTAQSTNSIGTTTAPPQTQSPPPSSAAGDIDDDTTAAPSGTLTYVTELDYQDLVEKTPGRPWPKVLNLRKISSVEESKASETFKEELLALNVHMLKPADLVFHSLLGRGSSANVYQGVLSSSESDSIVPENKEVALKILNTSPTDLRSVLKAHKETMDELVVVQRVQSPHVVRLFGIIVEPSICIVLEFCHKGSLYDVLCSDMKLGWAQCLQWFREIALGTLALHTSEPVIVHRDLKSLNLLVDDHDKIKVADFGLSRLNEGSADQLATLSKMRGTYIYCAPEIYFGEPFTPLSDVYSIGIIFWELIVKLITGHYQRPFAEYPAVSFGFQVVIMASRKGVRPTIPSCPKLMQTLLISMWNSSPKNRPSCKDLLTLLDHIEKEYLEHKEEWDSGQNYVPELKDLQPPPPELLGPSAGSSPGGSTTTLPPSNNTSSSSINANSTSTTTSSGDTTPRGTLTSGSGSFVSPKGSTSGSADSPRGSSSAPKLRKSTKTSLPSFKGIFPTAGKEKEKSSKRRSSGKPKPQFEDLLTDTKLYKALETKLHKEHSVEYLHFFKAVRQFEAKYKDRTTAENLTDAKYIETLLTSVSGDDRLIDQIRAKIKASSPEVGMFTTIQGEVTGILKTKFLAHIHE